MKKIFLVAILSSIFCSAFFISANAQLTTTPSGGNKKAVVGERIGLTDVTIHYDRPGVKKRDGKIWGQLIPVGYTDQGFGNTKQAPWRAGANENTTIEFSTDVKIEGQSLAAGKYGFFVAYDPNECTLIFSKNSSSWGSFFYDPKEDVLRVKVKPVANDRSIEWLKYEFAHQTENSAIIELQWEKLIIPFKVKTDLNNIQLETFRKELRSDKGFLWESWQQAAQWCVDNNTNLDEALLWADTSVSLNFGGDRSFQSWSTKAQVLNKLGRSAEADETMKKALPFGNEFEVNQYVRELISQKKSQEAFNTAKWNYDKHPGVFVATFGMARAYSALGNYKKALEFAQKAQPLATTPLGKSAAEKAIKTLQEGKDIN